MPAKEKKDEHNEDEQIEVLLFDLDGTLYDNACGYADTIHQQIFQFMVETKGGKFDAITTVAQAEAIWAPIYNKYNLTKRGLIGEGYIFDSHQYDTYIRRGAAKYISKDPQLRRFLQSFPSRMQKVIVTNAPESSAIEILELLGVRDLFKEVLGTDFFGPTVCKPEPEAFQKVLQHLGLVQSPEKENEKEPSTVQDDINTAAPATTTTNNHSPQDPENTKYQPPHRYRNVCYFEDSFKNLHAGQRDFGFRTVWIVSTTTLEAEGSLSSSADRHHFDAILHNTCVHPQELHAQLPELWEE